MHLYFKSKIKMNIKTVKIIWENNLLPATNMVKDGAVWSAEIKLKKGEYHYRFLVNHTLLLNDPYANLYAPDHYSMIWSVLLVDSFGNRVYNSSQYSLSLDHYNISNKIYDDTGLLVSSKKVFNRFIDELVAFHFVYSKVTGLHTATLVWSDIYGKIIEITERNIYPNNGLNKSICFPINLKDSNNMSGIWKAQLYIDGEYILEDNFKVSRLTIYDRTGNLIHKNYSSLTSYH